MMPAPPSRSVTVLAALVAIVGRLLGQVFTALIVFWCWQLIADRLWVMTFWECFAVVFILGELAFTVGNRFGVGFRP